MKELIYQLLPRLWGPANTASDGCSDASSGRFSHVDEATLRYLGSLGITHLWVTGVLRHATRSRIGGFPPSSSQFVKGEAGSPYAITDYYDVNPYLADDPARRMEEFDAMVARIHAAGMKVILDFVPNHVSRDYGRFSHRPDDLGAQDDPTVHWKPENDFYYYPGEALRLPEGTLPEGEEAYQEYPARASGNAFTPAPGVNDWYDTVKLNYCDFHTPTWDKMYNIVRFWAGRGVDGFRCDMVELVPPMFFTWLIQKIKEEFPAIQFIAEVYQKGYYRKYVSEVGFDLLYDKSGLYDRLRALVEGNGNAEELTWNWQELGDLQPHMLNFLENHDEQRIASDFFAADAAKAFPALDVSLLFTDAPFMLYFGQEVGEKGMNAEGFSGVDGRTSIFDWCKAPLEGRLWEYVHTGRGLSRSERAILKHYRERLNLSKSLSGTSTYDLCWLNYTVPGFDRHRHFAFLRGSRLFPCSFGTSPVPDNLILPY